MSWTDKGIRWRAFPAKGARCMHCMHGDLHTGCAAGWWCSEGFWPVKDKQGWLGRKFKGSLTKRNGLSCSLSRHIITSYLLNCNSYLNHGSITKCQATGTQRVVSISFTPFATVASLKKHLSVHCCVQRTAGARRQIRQSPCPWFNLSRLQFSHLRNEGAETNDGWNSFPALTF